MEKHHNPAEAGKQPHDKLLDMLNANTAPPFAELLTLEWSLGADAYDDVGRIRDARARLGAFLADAPDNSAPLRDHVGWLLCHMRAVWSRDAFQCLTFPDFVRHFVVGSLQNCICNNTGCRAAQLLRLATGQPRHLSREVAE